MRVPKTAFTRRAPRYTPLQSNLRLNRPLPMTSRRDYPLTSPSRALGPLVIVTSLVRSTATDRDVERGRILMGASVHQVESAELASLTQPSTGLLNANEDAGFDIDGNSGAITDGRSVGFLTSSTTPVNFGQKPGAGILESRQSAQKRPSVLRSGTPSCGLTRN
jgi:hypothetical protein